MVDLNWQQKRVGILWTWISDAISEGLFKIWEWSKDKYLGFAQTVQQFTQKYTHMDNWGVVLFLCLFYVEFFKNKNVPKLHNIPQVLQ